MLLTFEIEFFLVSIATLLSCTRSLSLSAIVIHLKFMIFLGIFLFLSLVFAFSDFSLLCFLEIDEFRDFSLFLLEARVLESSDYWHILFLDVSGSLNVAGIYSYMIFRNSCFGMHSSSTQKSPSWTLIFLEWSEALFLWSYNYY
jgi:hypothetical protein